MHGTTAKKIEGFIAVAVLRQIKAALIYNSTFSDALIVLGCSLFNYGVNSVRLRN
jgi:hypothetical protein